MKIDSEAPEIFTTSGNFASNKQPRGKFPEVWIINNLSLQKWEYQLITEVEEKVRIAENDDR